MRGIKFRAWDKERQEIIKWDEYLKDEFTGDYFEDDDLVIMQYTGLKDKNGVEIYEGDLVRCWGGEYNQGFWEFNEKIMVDSITNPFTILSLTEAENTEIIGNVYENP